MGNIFNGVKNAQIFKTTLLLFVFTAFSYIFFLPRFVLADTSLPFWGEINTNGVAIRSAPSVQSAKLGAFSTLNRIKVLDQVSGNSGTWYKIDGGVYPGAYVFSSYVTPLAQPTVPTNFTIPQGVNSGDYWINVNISKETLTFFQYDKPVMATYVSTGKFRSSTPVGTFHIWEKLLKTRMHGGPPATDHVYDLPNVPYTMYYNGSLAVHGTYWHDKFGTPQSAGCTNLTQGDAQFIFNKVSVGTVVYNHY